MNIEHYRRRTFILAQFVDGEYLQAEIDGQRDIIARPTLLAR